MNESQLYEQVTGQLGKWQRRRLWSDALLWLPRGLLVGLVAAALVAALARLRPILYNQEVALTALIMSLLGLLFSLFLLLLRKQSLLDQARFFDRLFGLKERLSAAVEIQAGWLSAPPELASEQLANTAKVVALVNAEAMLPLRPRRTDLFMILLAGGLLLLAVLLPNHQATILAEQEAVSDTIADQVVALQAVEQRILEDPSLDDAGRQALAEPVRSALSELTAGQLSREETVAILSQAEVDLRELSRSDNAENMAGALQAAGQPLASDSTTSALGQALSSSDLSRAAAATVHLAETLEQLSNTKREELAQSLAETADALSEVDPALSSELSEAAQALQRDEVAGAEQSLQAAAATLQQRAQEQAVATQAQAAAGELQTAHELVASAGASSGTTPSEGGNLSSQGSIGPGQAAQGSGSEQGANPGAIQAAGAENQDGQGAGGPGPGGGHAETIFVPNGVDLSGEGGVQIELPAECVANPENCGALISESPSELGDERSLVPYNQVFGDYRDAAFEALDGDYVPLGMKGLVRDYFSSLEP